MYIYGINYDGDNLTQLIYRQKSKKLLSFCHIIYTLCLYIHNTKANKSCYK